MTSKSIHETLGWCIWLESGNLAHAFKCPSASHYTSEEGVVKSQSHCAEREENGKQENREQVLVWELFDLMWHASHPWYFRELLTWFTIINSAIFTSSRSKPCAFQTVLLCMWKALNTGLKTKTHWGLGSCPHKRWQLFHLVCLAFFHKAAIQQTFLARANPMPGTQRLYFAASFQPAQFLARGQGTAFNEFFDGASNLSWIFFFKVSNHL